MKKVEIMAYVLAVAAVVTSVLCIIENKPAGAISCWLSAIALFLSGRSIHHNEKTRKALQELIDITAGINNVLLDDAKRKEEKIKQELKKYEPIT